MKKQSLLKILMLAIIAFAAVFVVAAVRNDRPMASREECMKEEASECEERKVQSEFLLESLTRNLLGR